MKPAYASASETDCTQAATLRTESYKWRKKSVRHRNRKFLARPRKYASFVFGDCRHPGMPESLSSVSFETRAVVGSIYSAMRAANMPVRDAHRFISACLFGVCVRKLTRRKSSKEVNDNPFAGKELYGLPKVVSEEKYRLLVGWILTKTDSGFIVKMEDARTTVQHRSLQGNCPQPSNVNGSCNAW